MLGGCPVHERLERRLVRLAGELVTAFTGEIPLFRRLPREELDGDVTRITEHNLRVVCGMFRERRPPTPGELAPSRVSAARWAREGVPVDALLAAYHLGVRRVWEDLFGRAGAGDLDEVLAANRLILAYTGSVASTVCAAYLGERESMLSQERHAMHATVSALLAGDRAALAGTRLAPRYLVVATALGAHADERGGAVAGWRAPQRMRTAFQRYAAEPVLSALDSTGGLVLVPVSGREPTWCEVGEMVAAAGRAARAPLWGAAEWAEPGGVPAAARLTGEVLEVVRGFGRPPGAYRLADVLLEYQLTRPSAAMAGLAGLLDPLVEHPDLLRTLTAFLDTGLDRRRTAELLHVHPNTVDYRLRRASGLTGLDPADPAQLQRIGAALTVRRTLAAGRTAPEPGR
jgi:hypothetical protein